MDKFFNNYSNLNQKAKNCIIKSELFISNSFENESKWDKNEKKSGLNQG